MDPLPPITLRLRGRKIIGRLAFTLLLICAILFGVGAGLLFVYSSDLPEVRALEDYQPNVVTEIYADDGASIGSFALQRRILLTYEQIPPVLRDAVTSAEDQHFFEHWGVDLPRAVQAAWRNVIRGHISEGASTLTMQLAGTLFLDRSNRSFRRKIQEVLLAIQIERHYTKQQILAMYCNQIYLEPRRIWHGGGFGILFRQTGGQTHAAGGCHTRRNYPRTELFAGAPRAARAGPPQHRDRSDGARGQDQR